MQSRRPARAHRKDATSLFSPSVEIFSLQIEYLSCERAKKTQMKWSKHYKDTLLNVLHPQCQQENESQLNVFLLVYKVEMDLLSQAYRPIVVCTPRFHLLSHSSCGGSGSGSFWPTYKEIAFAVCMLNMKLYHKQPLSLVQHKGHWFTDS